MQTRIALGEIKKVAFIVVNGYGEHIIVDTDRGLDGGEGQQQACLCGTCRGPMSYHRIPFSERAVLNCEKCGLRIMLASQRKDYAALRELFPRAVEERCGRCLGEKIVLMRPLTSSGTAVSAAERVTCPACQGR